MQPSAQGIASLFMGNPGALAARVDQDRKQSPMGIPDDLRQLMALNIVTTENDAAKRQQALNELQQMAPNGQPPTVADNVRQQAAQKLQAQMVQQQQKQQAMQQMMGGLPAAGIPQGTPQPERQPQGIDEAPVEFGMAGGGIVSFNGEEGSRVPKYESLSERAERQMREKGSIYDPYFGYPEEERKRMKREADLREAQERAKGFSELAQGNVQALVGQAQTRLADLEQNKDDYIRRFGAKQYQQAVDRATAALGTAQTRGSEILGRQAQRNQEGIAAAIPPKPEAPISRPTEQMRPQQMEAFLKPSAPAPAPAPAKDLKDLVRKAPAPAPAAPRLGAAEQALQAGAKAVGTDSAAQKALAEIIAQDPTALSAKAVEAFKQAVPGPDFTQRDAAIRALEAERTRLTEPKAGWEGLAEYMSQIAAGAAPGRSSLQAGAAGARGMQAAQEARAQKRFDLGMKIVEQEQGKIDATRAYALETYNVGKKEFDAIFARKFEAAKSMVTDEREARKLAAEMTMRELEMNSREKVADRQIAAANARVKDETGKERLAGLKALQSSLTDQLKSPRMMGPAGDSLRAQLARVDAEIARMVGLGKMETVPDAKRLGEIPPEILKLLNKYGG